VFEVPRTSQKPTRLHLDRTTPAQLRRRACGRSDRGGVGGRFLGYWFAGV